MGRNRKMPRFSIRSLLLWVAFVALCIAGLKYPSDWNQIVAHLIMAGIVGYSVPMAFISTGRIRVFRISFCSSLLMYQFGVYLYSYNPSFEAFWTLIHGPTGSFAPEGYGGFFQVLHVLIGVVFSTGVATLVSWSAERHLKNGHT